MARLFKTDGRCGLLFAVFAIAGGEEEEVMGGGFR